MKISLLLLLLATVAVATVAGKNSVFGIIKSNTTWFLSNLSVRPAMTASFEYHVQYPYVEGRARPIITFYYNGQYSPNVEAKCERDLYGQLRNEDLAVPLNETRICYNDTSSWYCSGNTKIQDFEPKSYSFSFCNECGSTNGNLNGLWYKVTIYDESNKTSCVDLNMAQGQRINRCERNYQYAAIPNQIGGTHLDTIMWELGQTLGILDRIIDLATHKSCPLEFYQMLCLVALPECLPEQNEIVLPCREYCESLLDNCLKIGAIVILVEEFDLNCKYLPTQNDSVPCFMQVDICGPPLEINHGFILEGTIPFAQEGHVVHYACNDSWILTGSPNSTCKASGEWTTPPACLEPRVCSMMSRENIKNVEYTADGLNAIIYVGVLCSLVLIVGVALTVVFCRKRRKKLGQSEPSGTNIISDDLLKPLTNMEIRTEIY